MFTNRLSIFFIVISIVALTLVTLSFTNSPKNSQSYQDYAQRHADKVLLPVTGNSEASSDYYQRHPELSSVSTRNVDLTDFFFRQAGVSVHGIDLTDFYFRH